MHSLSSYKNQYFPNQYELGNQKKNLKRDVLCILGTLFCGIIMREVYRLSLIYD